MYEKARFLKKKKKKKLQCEFELNGPKSGPI